MDFTPIVDGLLPCGHPERERSVEHEDWCNACERIEALEMLAEAQRERAEAQTEWAELPAFSVTDEQKRARKVAWSRLVRADEWCEREEQNARDCGALN